MGYLSEFRAFLLKQNALALAIGVVVGAAFGRLVSGLVDDLIMPVIALLTPGGEWRTAGLQIGTNAKGEAVKLLIGDVGGRMLDFVIVAFVIFLMTKLFLKEAKPPPSKVCPECREAVPLEARRCKFSTQPVA
jgi:large conductance mechanosensitive channel